MFEYVNDARKEIMNICFHSSREMCIINFISNYFWEIITKRIESVLCSTKIIALKYIQSIGRKKETIHPKIRNKMRKTREKKIQLAQWEMLVWRKQSIFRISHYIVVVVAMAFLLHTITLSIFFFVFFSHLSQLAHLNGTIEQK